MEGNEEEIKLGKWMDQYEVRKLIYQRRLRVMQKQILF